MLHILVRVVNAVSFHIRQTLGNILRLIVLQLVLNLKILPDIIIRLLVALRQVTVPRLK